MDEAMIAAANVLTTLLLLAGLFFMTVGAIGLARFPDLYTRSHALGKCVTLGISGLLLALVIYVGTSATEPSGEAQAEVAREMAIESGTGNARETTTAVATKAILVIFFSFLAVPVGSHMLARAGHLAGVVAWDRTVGDELAEDEGADAGRLEPPDAGSDVAETG